MELMTPPLIWAQTQSATVNPNSIALLALRRWCSSLTLSSPQPVPSLHGLWAIAVGFGLLFVMGLFSQGLLVLLTQLFDLPGHVRVVQKATRRVCAPGRMISITIGFTVLSWTTGQSLVFIRDSGQRIDLSLLTKSRRPAELALEQGILAGMTPLRDVAGLGDNLPLLIFAAIVLFRASLDLTGWESLAGKSLALGCATAPRAGRH